MATLNNVVRWDADSHKDVPVTDVAQIDSEARLDTDPTPFKAYGKIERSTNRKLCEQIKSKLSSVFHDLAGVYISMNPTAVNSFIVELFFEWNALDVPENKIRNLESLTTASKSNTWERMHSTYNRASGKTFTINDETKYLLAPYMYGGKNANKPKSRNWANCISEAHMQNNNMPYFVQRGADRVFVRVTGLDIRRLIRLVYGDTIIVETTNKVGDDGQMSAVNCASPNARYDVLFSKYLRDGEFALNIVQYDSDATAELYAEENPVIQQQCGVVRFY